MRAAAAVFFFALVASAEEQVYDPVCRMVFPKSEAACEADHEGHRYYFCMERCRADFLAAPAAYPPVVQVVRGLAVSFMPRNSRVWAKTPTDFILDVRDAGEPVVLKSASVTFRYEATGMQGLSIGPEEMTAMKEPGVWRVRRSFVAPGRLAFTLDLEWPDGAREQAAFAVRVLPADDEATGLEHRGQALTMVTQHELMRKTGKFWVEAGLSLEGGDGAAARAALAKAAGYQEGIGRMVPHVFEDEVAELRAASEAYGEALADVDRAIEKENLEAARARWRAVDALHCTKCHMKFRWGTFARMDSYPVVK